MNESPLSEGYLNEPEEIGNGDKMPRKKKGKNSNILPIGIIILIVVSMVFLTQIPITPRIKVIAVVSTNPYTNAAQIQGLYVGKVKEPYISIFQPKENEGILALLLNTSIMSTSGFESIVMTKINTDGGYYYFTIPFKESSIYNVTLTLYQRTLDGFIPIGRVSTQYVNQ